MRRNHETERPGLRYGKRTVLRAETVIVRDHKEVWLVVRCDCGRVDSVPKYRIVNGESNQCKACAARGNARKRIDRLEAEVTRLRAALAVHGAMP